MHVQGAGVFIADTGNDRIVYWPDGATQGSVIDPGLPDPTGVSRPSAIAAGPKVTDVVALFIADTGNHRVIRATFNIGAASVTDRVGLDVPGEPRALAYYDGDAQYVTDQYVTESARA